MNDKTHIAIIGIGAVGGYYGGLLAGHYHQSDDVEVSFIVRGENKKTIIDKGLRIQADEFDKVVHPDHITDDPSTLKTLDYLICSTKSYGLLQSIEQAMPCINEQTVILPLLNGVDSRDRIKGILPENEVWDGCAYIVSRLKEPGLIQTHSSLRTLYFGSDNGTEEKLKKAEQILRDAGIDVKWSKEIKKSIWEKFIFISAMATLTSYLDGTVGEVLAGEKGRNLFHSLLNEIKAVADARQIPLSENIVQDTIKKSIYMPPESTTSMHSDFQAGKATEVESLTGYVVKSGHEMGKEVPLYEMMYKKLKQG